MAKGRPTTKYHLKMGHRIIQPGITDRTLQIREQEHQAEFPGCHLVKVGRKTTRRAALDWEQRESQRLQAN